MLNVIFEEAMSSVYAFCGEVLPLARDAKGSDTEGRGETTSGEVCREEADAKVRIA